MRKLQIVFAAALLAAGVAAQGQEAEAGADEAATQTESFETRASYSIGINIGRGLAAQAAPVVDLELDQLMEGISDGLAGTDARMAEEEILAALQELQQRAGVLQQRLAAEAGQSNAAEGEAFLQQNGARDGVTTTESGLQYEVLTAGDGAMPTATDRVSVHYTGSLIDGTVFDSSVERGTPATFGVNGVISGWTEALQLMTVGSKWKLFIPSSLAYGENGSPPRIGPNSVLVFEVELLGIEEAG